MAKFAHIAGRQAEKQFYGARGLGKCADCGDVVPEWMMDSNRSRCWHCHGDTKKILNLCLRELMKDGMLYCRVCLRVVPADGARSRHVCSECAKLMAQKKPSQKREYKISYRAAWRRNRGISTRSEAAERKRVSRIGDVSADGNWVCVRIAGEQTKPEWGIMWVVRCVVCGHEKSVIGRNIKQHSARCFACHPPLPKPKIGGQRTQKKRVPECVYAAIYRDHPDYMSLSESAKSTIMFRYRYRYDSEFREKQKQRTSIRKHVHPSTYMFASPNRFELVSHGDGTVTKEALRALYAQHTKCVYCGEEIRGSQKTLDHIVPLSRGGKHSMGNLTIACKRCNLMKSNKHADEFVRTVSR